MGNRVSARSRPALQSATAHAGLAPRTGIWECAELALEDGEGLKQPSKRLLSKAETAELQVSGEEAAEVWDRCGESSAR